MLAPLDVLYIANNIPNGDVLHIEVRGISLLVQELSSHQLGSNGTLCLISTYRSARPASNRGVIVDIEGFEESARNTSRNCGAISNGGAVVRIGELCDYCLVSGLGRRGVSWVDGVLSDLKSTEILLVGI